MSSTNKWELLQYLIKAIEAVGSPYENENYMATFYHTEEIKTDDETT